MTTTLPTKKAIGKLAQARRPRGPLIETKNTPLFYQAVEQMDGWTYPVLGQQLGLYVKATAMGTIAMSRESHASSTATKKLIMTLIKKGGG